MAHANTWLAERIEQLRQRHRDPLLTTLTLLLVFIMFVAAPLQAVGLVAFQLLAILAGFLTIGIALVLSRSAAVVAAMVVAFGMNVIVAVLRFVDAPSSFDLHMITGAWLIIAVALAMVVARVVFGPGKVTYHRIIGAVLLYLLIALAFVSLLLIVCLWEPNAIAGIRLEDTPSLASHMIYFSFATLTTTGYGDIVPVHPVARSLCNLEAIIGQLYPATLLARLVTLELAGRC